MKLRNKKTGEIKTAYVQVIVENNNPAKPLKYNTQISIAKLNEEWEDVPEEPKEYWYINSVGEVACIEDDDTMLNKAHKGIGNSFETKEEAEKTVDKLKAVKRLKDKGFRFDRWYNDNNKYLGDFEIYAHIKDLTDIVDDLDLLFGGEE